MNNRLLGDLQRCLDYSPETGELRWKSPVCRGIKIGDLAGSIHPSNRLYVTFRGKRYLAHRLAWLLTHGKWPDGVIDHLDGNSLNNRLSNLRDVSRTVNGQNQRSAQSRNKTGFLGVSWHSRDNRFQASIRFNGKDKHLGYFLTPEEAHAAYLAAKRELHEGCTI